MVQVHSSFFTGAVSDNTPQAFGTYRKSHADYPPDKQTQGGVMGGECMER